MDGGCEDNHPSLLSAPSPPTPPFPMSNNPNHKEQESNKDPETEPSVVILKQILFEKPGDIFL